MLPQNLLTAVEALVEMELRDLPISPCQSRSRFRLHPLEDVTLVNEGRRGEVRADIVFGDWPSLPSCMTSSKG